MDSKEIRFQIISQISNSDHALDKAISKIGDDLFNHYSIRLRNDIDLLITSLQLKVLKQTNFKGLLKYEK